MEDEYAFPIGKKHKSGEQSYYSGTENDEELELSLDGRDAPIAGARGTSASKQ